MDSSPEEEKLLVEEVDTKPQKGGLRTIPFIIVNEAFETLASIGIIPNMVFYLMDNYHLEVTVISTFFSLWSTLSNGLSIVGASIADAYWGRYRVIVIGSFFSLTGMIGIWLTAMFPQLRGEACNGHTSTCNPPNAAQLSFLFLSFVLISIGAGCIRPCSVPFGMDQLGGQQKSNNTRLIQSFVGWYSISLTIASVFALTVIVYIQDNWGWKVGFGIPAVLMLFSAITILLGSSLYVHVKPSKSLLAGPFQVPFVAFRNRKLDNPSNTNDYLYYHTMDSKLSVPTDSLRCLNRACTIYNPGRDLNPDGVASNPWKLCTIEQVESFKAIIRVMPIWFTGVMLQFSLCQNSFSTLQAKSMNRHIIGSFEFPAASFGVVMSISVILWLILYDRAIVPILAKFTGNSHGISPQVRIAISIIISMVSMVISALVEAHRRKLVIEKGSEDDPYASTDMSAMWLVPQYVLMGVAEAISGTSQTEFFYLQLPKSMSSMAMALLTIEQGAASLINAIFVNVVNKVTSGEGKISWLASNINKGHIDYYCWLIAFIGLLNFLYFLIPLQAFRKFKDVITMYGQQIDEEEEDKEGSSYSSTESVVN